MDQQYINALNEKVTVLNILTCLEAQLLLPTTSTKDKTVFLQQNICNIADLSHAKSDEIAFIAHRKYLVELTSSKAMVVIISRKLLDEIDTDNLSTALLIVDDAYLGFAKISGLFVYKPDIVFHECNSDDKRACEDKHHQQISDTAKIHPTVTLGNNVAIAHNVVIGTGCMIGDNTKIYANTVIEDYAVIGRDCIIKSNVSIGHHTQLGDDVHVHNQSSIGSDGFGFAPDITTENFRWQKISQLGKVIIGNNVRIGANTCVDRGALGDTIIESGVIIDNLVQIAHNVRIGANTAIAACTGISGSTKIGKNCIIAGGVGIAGHLNIVDNVTLTGMTLVTGSINQAGSYSSGTGMMLTKEWRKAAVNFKALAESPFKTIFKEIKNLKEKK